MRFAFLILVTALTTGCATTNRHTTRPAPAPGPTIVPASPAPGARFLDHGDYIEDTTTGLLWQTDGDVSGKLNFFQANEYAWSLNLGGLSNWRVPSREELAGIFPATEPPFTDTHYTSAPCCNGPYEWSSYWTCEMDHRMDDYAYVYQWYADGGANNCYASKNYAYVRCVHDRVKK